MRDRDKESRPNDRHCKKENTEHAKQKPYPKQKNPIKQTKIPQNSKLKINVILHIKGLQQILRKDNEKLQKQTLYTHVYFKISTRDGEKSYKQRYV